MAAGAAAPVTGGLSVAGYVAAVSGTLGFAAGGFTGGTALAGVTGEGAE